MALIKCTDCKKKISDSVEICPNCGKKITEDDKTKGFLLIRNSKKKKRFTICLISILSVLLVIFGMFFANKESNEKKEEERIATEKTKKEEEEYKKEHNDYVNIMNECYNASQEMNIKVQELSSLITRVWHNSIFEEKDKDTDKYTIKNGKFLSFDDSVNKCIEKEAQKKKFLNVGKDFSDKYAKVLKLEIPERDKNNFIEYDAFIRDYSKMIFDFYQFVIMPSGNYNEFSQSVNDYERKISEKQSEILNIQIPEVK